MRVILTDKIPIRQRPRIYLLTVQKITEKQVEKLFKNGIIMETFSDYATPGVLTMKKDSLHS